MEFTITLLIAAISAGTPLLLAALGGILSERAGIIHLGTEGIMLMGAVLSCMTYITTQSLGLALLSALLGTALLGGLHALLTVTLHANQTVSGLAITLFGTGLSAYLGKKFSGQPIPGSVPKLDLPWLEAVPFAGRLLAHQDWIVWFSLVLVVALHTLIYRTSWGLHLRAVGDSPGTADVMGIPVALFRYTYVVLGSMLMGLAGSYLILAYSPSWTEGMTAGRGWIAVALIIFARWNPVRALFAAYLFGGLDALGFRIQLLGTPIPSYFLKMMPYLITIGVLMYVGWKTRSKPSGGPEALGLPYLREQRH
ncbi:ABC transporter permease [Paenibacillus validus]|uniref:ABC transporter permease n=1 Tax=Paenibacillus validus TaxID=44253 RepID=A0A7X3CRY5_9BACL|nr:MULTISPECIES: ABC transporter permease [Paenibacillus]MED4604538.1 ABC transporter permease [Paenibacillus validus]MED4609829.1 ABC transporter permease [Paenibacillus validus]MUG70732.1 ABC transporter permease [Paenibacillus validus]